MKSSTSGFTLIELLVVIAVIGVMMSSVIVAINPAARLGDARDAERKTALRGMANALEAYYALNGQYPYMWGWGGECPHPWGHANLPRTGPNGYIPNLAPDWIKLLPTDPKYGGSTDGRCYIYLSNGTDYKLLAHNTPEGGYSPTDPFYDPVRPTWAWQVSSSEYIRTHW